MGRSVFSNKLLIKLKKQAINLCFLLFPALQTEAANSTLTLESVLKSTEKHHPKLAAILAKQQQAANKRLAAEGAFDWQWQQKWHTRPSGYYDGWTGEQKASRQLSFANAKMNVGYRISDGRFPIYENERETLSGGEFSIGADFSLLRNRNINSVSLKQFSASQNEKIAQLQQLITLNNLLRIASHYYLDWYYAFHQLKITKERLQLANTREKALAEQVAQGNRAQMSLNDFERERLKRRADVIKAQQSLDKAAWELALYQRNEKGEPQRPSNVTPPSTLNNLEKFRHYFSEQWLNTVIANHPDIRTLNAQQSMQTKRLDFAKNQGLPKLDMSVKLARDIGSGSKTLEGNESIVSLNFALPIEKRLVRGKIQTEKARLNELKWQKKNRKEQLASQINGLIQRLQQSQILVDITNDQTQLAKRLVEQENQLFTAGDSTQFLLNSRESDYATAQLDTLTAEISQRRLVIDLLALAGEMSPNPW